MKLFGFEIKKAEDNFRRILPELLYKWYYGKEWVSGQNMVSLLKAYKSWVYIAASRNAASFAATPLKLFVAKESTRRKLLCPVRDVSILKQSELRDKFYHIPAVRKAEEIGEVTEHILMDLLYHINPFMNKTDALEISDIYLELTGNAYWLLIFDKIFGVPREVWPIPPDRIKIIPHKDKFIVGYRYEFGNFKLDLSTSQIIHFKWPNPNDSYYGASPLQAIADIYNINENMNKYENAVFSNNGRLDGYYTTEQEVDDASFKRLKQELQDAYGGVSNSGKTPLLDYGLEFKPFNLAPKDLGFLQGRRWTKAEIFEAYDTPMGLFDEKANRANAEAAQFTYMKYGIQPRLRRFEEKLNEQLVPLFDDKLFLAFDEVVPADNEFKLKEDTELVRGGIKVINEARKERGWAPVDGGDVPLVQMQMVPLGSSIVAQQQASSQQSSSKPTTDEEIVEEVIGILARKARERIYVNSK